MTVVANNKKKQLQLNVRMLLGQTGHPLARQQVECRNYTGTGLARGVRQVSCKLYKDARHEIINETNRDEVYRDLLQFLKAKGKGETV